MADKRPTVSVVMATYNGEKYIKEQIDSILNQSYPIYELIIQDDCSTDSTPMICREYEEKYPFIHFYENSQNLGYDKNFETATMRSKGDYVALSDQDDVWYPSKIEKQIAAIKDNDICFTCHHRGSNRKNSVYVTPQYSLPYLLFADFAGHTMLLRGEFARDPKNWFDYIHYDWSLAIQAQLGNGIVRVDEPLNWHRSHSDSAVAMEHKNLNKEFKKKLTWQPYVYGWRNYRVLQNKDNWKKLYSYIYNSTSPSNHPLTHKMSGLMLKKGILPLIKLCFLSMKHRDIIYWNNNAKGFIGIIRGFAYPLIFTVNNVQYDR